MKTYRIYEAKHGKTIEHGTIEAETATAAIQTGGFGVSLDSPIETNEADESAWQPFPDHSDSSDQSEHLYCADGPLAD